MITIGRLDRGGAELRTYELLKRIKETTDHKIFIYVASGKQGSLDKYFEAIGVKIIFGKKSLGGILNLIKILKEISPDVVHCNANLASGIYCMAAYISGIKKRISHIRTTEDYATGPLYITKKKIYQTFISIFSTNIVGVCESAQKLSGAKDGKWRTIYNGITPASIPPSQDPSKGSLICIGRMHEAKNQIYCISILSDLHKYHPEINWTLDFYGKEDEGIKRKIIKEAEELDVIEKIRFNGLSDSPQKTISNYSVLLLPSTREGLPGVVLEAASVGVPSVCSDLPGCKEISKHLAEVTTIPLGNIREWSNSILKATHISREATASNFSKSPFMFEQHYLETLSLWTKS